MQKRIRQLLTASEKAGLSRDQALKLFASVLQQEKEDALAVSAAKIHNRFHTESVVVEELIERDYHPTCHGIVHVA